MLFQDYGTPTHTPREEHCSYVIFLPLGHLPSGLSSQCWPSWSAWQGVHNTVPWPGSAVSIGIMRKDIYLNQFTSQRAPNQTQKRNVPDICILSSFLFFAFLYLHEGNILIIRNDIGQLKFKTLKPISGLVYENKLVSQDQTQKLCFHNNLTKNSW